MLQRLRDRARTSQAGELTAMHKINHLLDLWEAKFQEQVTSGRRSPTSLDTYRRAIKNHIRPALGELRIGEATTPRIDKVISKIKQNAGAPTARTSRAVISGMMQLAVRYGAITVNPVREVDRIEHPTKKLPRALRTDEAKLLRDHLKTNETAVRADLPDLVTFMLGTGVRIGESLAVLWHQIDLDNATVNITHTIVRIKGQGLLRKPTKSTAGNRQLGLPNWLVATLRTRAAAGFHLDDPVFADTHGGYRDPNNVRRSLRTSLAPVGNTTRIGFMEERAAALARALADDGRLVAAATALTDAEVRAPSGLPGWMRGHVLSHVARSADAYTWLLRSAQGQPHELVKTLVAEARTEAQMAGSTSYPAVTRSSAQARSHP